MRLAGFDPRHRSLTGMALAGFRLGAFNPRARTLTGLACVECQQKLSRLGRLGQRRRMGRFGQVDDSAYEDYSDTLIAPTDSTPLTLIPSSAGDTEYETFSNTLTPPATGINTAANPLASVNQLAAQQVFGTSNLSQLSASQNSALQAAISSGINAAALTAQQIAAIKAAAVAPPSLIPGVTNQNLLLYGGLGALLLIVLTAKK